MFGISPLGWMHTLGSLPAIPAAVYMLVRYGRIVPCSTAGRLYLVCMLVGGLSVFLVARQPVSYGVGVVTTALLLMGYGIGRRGETPGVARYVQTVCLTLTVFLLMLPTVTEILTRVPDGHPLVASLDSPRLRAVHGALVIALITGLVAQMLYLRFWGKATRSASR